MDGSKNTWVIVLAAGNGSRLHSLTTNELGIAVPKQFCSLQGDRSLLRGTIERAHAIASPEHICVVVAAQHRRWWTRELADMPEANVIVQPDYRGTANDILLPLLHIMARAPDARIVLLPSDHHIRDESILAASLQQGIRALDQRDKILLLGISPDEVDTELGYILTRAARNGEIAAVDRFVEKPDAASAARLIAAGALWNTFIIMTKANTLLKVFEARFPQIVVNMQTAVARDFLCPHTPDATEVVYKILPQLDFSRDVLEKETGELRVLRVGNCGWSDLGNPKRVAQTLKRLPSTPLSVTPGSSPNHLSGFVNLSA